MQPTSFNNWKNHPVTKALMNFLQEQIASEKYSIPTWEDIEQPEKLAYKMGRIHTWESILNIDKEDLKEDESEGDAPVR